MVTEAYKKYAGKVSVPVLRALTFQHLMENKTIVINDGELIVGERGPAPQSAPTFPELCCHSVEDFEIIDRREKIYFRVDEETKRIQKEVIIPYWQGKSMRDLLFNNMTEEWKECYEAGIFTEFMEQRAPGHTVGGDQYYKKGFLDFKKEIEEEIAALDFLNDPDAYDKQEELKAMAIACDAIITLGRRYWNWFTELAEETDPVRKKELEQIGEEGRVPAYAPGLLGGYTNVLVCAFRGSYGIKYLGFLLSRKIGPASLSLLSKEVGCWYPGSGPGEGTAGMLLG